MKNGIAVCVLLALLFLVFLVTRFLGESLSERRARQTVSPQTIQEAASSQPTRPVSESLEEPPMESLDSAFNSFGAGGTELDLTVSRNRTFQVPNVESDFALTDLEMEERAIQAEEILDHMRSPFESIQIVHILARDVYEEEQSQYNHKDEYWFKKPFSVSIRGEGKHLRTRYVSDGFFQELYVDYPGMTEPIHRFSSSSETTRTEFLPFIIFEPERWLLSEGDAEDTRTITSKKTQMIIDAKTLEPKEVSRLDQEGNVLFVAHDFVVDDFRVALGDGDEVTLRLPKRFRVHHYRNDILSSSKTTIIDSITFNVPPPDNEFMMRKPLDDIWGSLFEE